MRRGAFALVTLALLGSSTAGASPVGLFAIDGIVLGASLDFVQDGYPTMFLEEVEYQDPEVGLRYKAYLPVTSQRYIDHIVGRVQVFGQDGLTTMRATFTGDRRLYELVVIHERKDLDCDAAVAAAMDRWGQPEERGEGSLLRWVEQELDVHRRLEMRCFPGSGAQYTLQDPGLNARWQRDLRRSLAPFVEQALLRGG